MILTGDCVELMATLDADSVDAIVTDPPYGLEFMGKEWDSMRPGINRGGGAPGRSERQDNKLAPVEYGAAKPRSSFQCDSCGKRDKFKNPHTCEDPTWTRISLEQRFAAYGQIMQTWHETWAREAFRVAKPGAHLLAFGGTRTYHRLASAIEDAGWEIRDCLVWAYASGFPKSLDVSKAIDKAAGAERPTYERAAFGGTFSDDGGTTYGTAIDGTPITDAAKRWSGWGTALKPAWEPIVMARKPLRGTVASNVLAHGTGALNIDGTRIASDRTDTRHGGNGKTPGWNMDPDAKGYDLPAGRWPANVILTDPIFDGGVDGVVGGGTVKAGDGKDWSDGPVHGTDGVTDFVVQKPTGQHYGDTGTYSRFFLIPKAARSDREPVLRGQLERKHAGIAIRQAEPGEYEEFVYPAPEGIGVWLREQRETAGLSAKAVCAAIGAHGAVNHGGAVSNWEQELNRPTADQWRKLREVLGFDDRYDEVMTTVRSVDRKLMDGALPAQRANNHPTVKPVELMRHLVRLVTPPGGTVLDCFLGSGSTAIAAELEGFAWIGIEKEAEYVAIAEARLNGTQRGLGL